MREVNIPLYFLETFPIQYYAPLFEEMTASGIDLEVWYCSNKTVGVYFRNEFNTGFKWDVPLLEGYKYIFLKNYSCFKGFFSFINFGIISLILRKKRGIIIVHGWNFFTMLLAIMVAPLKGHKIWIKNENPISWELSKSKLNRMIKRVIFPILFSFCNKIFYIGTRNKEFFKYYGLKESKLIPFPFSVNNNYLTKQYSLLQNHRIELRTKFGINLEAQVILFCGKYIPKKGCMTLLEAFAKLSSSSAWLVFVGEGYLRNDMEAYIKEKSIQRVLLTGFVNQSKIAEYYAIADIFVLPSNHGETWGLVVNEAMNFGLPIIVSDRVGSQDDLVHHGKNGFVFKYNDVSELVRHMDVLVEDLPLRKRMGGYSLDMIKRHSYGVIVHNIKIQLEQYSHEYGTLL